MLNIRLARETDCDDIFSLVIELAEYEQLAHIVTATVPQLRKHLFGERRSAEALMLEWSGEVAGFALYYHNFSTFVGKPGLYVEDIYVRNAYRRRGIGRAVFQYLAQLAMERGCGRMEWSVLNWNTPAVEFYQSLGAVPLTEWTVQRLTGDALCQLASRSEV